MRNQIKLIVPDKVYFGGDVIYGQIELVLHKPQKSRGVRFLFLGEEKTSWSESDSDNNSTTYSKTRIFLQHRQDLAGTPRDQRKNAEAEMVPPGTYQWPIAIALPPRVPPSCSHYYGSISYTMTAYVDVPMGFDLKHVFPLKVAGNLFDQLEYTLPAMPIERKKDKKFVFGSGKLEFSAKLVNSRLCPNNIAVAEVTITNNSSKDVKGIEYGLYAHERYTADSINTKTSGGLRHKMVQKIKVHSHTNHTCTLEYKIPDTETPTTFIEGSADPFSAELVQISYSLYIGLELSWAIDLKVDLPITLMHINPQRPYHIKQNTGYALVTPTPGAPYQTPPSSLPPYTVSFGAHTIDSDETMFTKIN